jgi:hypothetical protein
METNMSEQFDKLRILLLDDNPVSLCTEEVIDGQESFIPLITEEEFEPYFDVQWIATPEEAREFRDSSLITH